MRSESQASCKSEAHLPPDRGPWTELRPTRVTALYFILGLMIGTCASIAIISPMIRNKMGDSYIAGFKTATQRIQGDLEQAAIALRNKRREEDEKAHWWNLGLDKATNEAVYEGGASLLVNFRNHVTAEMLNKLDYIRELEPHK